MKNLPSRFLKGILLVMVGFLFISGTVRLNAPAVAYVPADELHTQLDQTAEDNNYFVTADVCGDCHSDILDEAGNSISFNAAWRSSVMANAANDPYWLASVRRETLANPAELTALIQDVCATCHMPMARFTANATENPLLVLDAGGYTDPSNELHTYAIEGVSCTVCHQIEAENLGKAESFDGGYLIPSKPLLSEDDRMIYGTFEVASTRQMTMGSGFAPVQSDHLTSSELCATCHQLITPYLDENDEIAGTIPEQMPYTEWLNSTAYQNQQNCVDCHMIRIEGSAPMFSDSDQTYPNLARHYFLGGNNFLLTLLGENGLGENIGARPEEFQMAIEINRAFLEGQTATISLENVAVINGELTADAVINSLSGHKLPTSYPSRRVWVHFTVTDSAGKIVFESGGYREDGLITGNDNDADATTYEPHYQEITSADEVQIYESIMVTTADIPTTTLLRGARYIKDNRLLPSGFDKTTVPVEIQVQGNANDDPDFVGGGDTIHYRIPLGEASGTLTVSVELLYQSISYRWAMELQNFSGDSAPEIVRFLDLYAQTPNLPERIASAEATVE